MDRLASENVYVPPYWMSVNLSVEQAMGGKG